MSYRQRWDALGARFLTLQARERALVGITLVVVILLLGWQFTVAPDLEKAERARLQANSFQAQTRELESQLMAFEAELARDPNGPLRQQRQRLQARLDELQGRLATLAGGLVSPQAMVALLRQMLNRHEGLTLESVAHTPAIPVESSNKGNSGPGLFSHGVTVTVSGRYFDLVEYLKELEGLDDRLGWSALQYDVQEWPVGRMEIHLKTLSLSEEWLGV